MKINYLNMIWDVKIFLAKIKDCKGKDLNCPAKKSLPGKIYKISRLNVILRWMEWIIFHQK